MKFDFPDVFIHTVRQTSFDSQLLKCSPALWSRGPGRPEQYIWAIMTDLGYHYPGDIERRNPENWHPEIPHDSLVTIEHLRAIYPDKDKRSDAVKVLAMKLMVTGNHDQGVKPKYMPLAVIATAQEYKSYWGDGRTDTELIDSMKRARAFNEYLGVRVLPGGRSLPDFQRIFEECERRIFSPNPNVVPTL